MGDLDGAIGKLSSFLAAPYPAEDDSAKFLAQALRFCITDPERKADAARYCLALAQALSADDGQDGLVGDTTLEDGSVTTTIQCISIKSTIQSTNPINNAPPFKQIRFGANQPLQSTNPINNAPPFKQIRFETNQPLQVVMKGPPIGFMGGGEVGEGIGDTKEEAAAAAAENKPAPEEKNLTAVPDTPPTTMTTLNVTSRTTTALNDTKESKTASYQIPGMVGEKTIGTIEPGEMDKKKKRRWTIALSQRSREAPKRTFSMVSLVDACCAFDFGRCVRDTSKRFVFKPENPTRMMWDIYMMVLILYYAFAVPVRIGFNRDPGHPMLEHFFTGCFGLDILINFNTALIGQGGTLILDRRLIAQDYMKAWFWIDFIGELVFGFGMSRRISQLEYGMLQWVLYIRVVPLPPLPCTPSLYLSLTPPPSTSPSYFSVRARHWFQRRW
jgi:hypothetical protein